MEEPSIGPKAQQLIYIAMGFHFYDSLHSKKYKSIFFCILHVFLYFGTEKIYIYLRCILIIFSVYISFGTWERPKRPCVESIMLFFYWCVAVACLGYIIVEPLAVPRHNRIWFGNYDINYRKLGLLYFLRISC